MFSTRNVCSQLASLAAVAALVVGASQANALSLTVTDAAPTNLVESLKFGVNNSSSLRMGTLNANDGASNFTVYCIDPLTVAHTPSTYNVTSLGNYLNGGAYASQFAQAPYITVQNATPSYDNQNTTTVSNKLVDLYSHAYNESLNDATKGAAFQYAVWEIIGESAYSATAGGLRMGSGSQTLGFQTQVEAYMSALTSGTWGAVNGADLSTASNFTYTVYVPNPQAGSQAFIRVVSSTGTNTNGVPEPGSVALAMVSLVAFGVSRRKARRAVAA